MDKKLSETKNSINYIINFIDTILELLKTDIEEYYNDMFKNALKYGMSSNEFWYGTNYKDYFLYEEAYYERLHETSHIQGYYNYISLTTALGNAFRQKGSKALEYPSINILASQKEKALKRENSNGKRRIKITQENKQQVYIDSFKNCY